MNKANKHLEKSKWTKKTEKKNWVLFWKKLSKFKKKYIALKTIYDWWFFDQKTIQFKKTWWIGKNLNPSANLKIKSLLQNKKPITFFLWGSALSKVESTSFLNLKQMKLNWSQMVHIYLKALNGMNPFM